MSASASASSSSTGSTWGEWEATSTATSRAMMSRCSQPATRSRTVCGEPPITVDAGEVTTATTTSSIPLRSSSSRTCCAGSSTAAIAPPPARRRHSSERWQMTFTPSARDRAPATTAAATSPMECPTTAPGRTPWEVMVSAIATCMAKMAGWMRSMPVTVSGASSASVTEKSDSAAISGSISAIFAANAGSAASRAAPIDAHCEPWPENTHTGPRSSWPTAAWCGSSPAAICASPSINSVRVPATAAVRTGRNPRRRDSV